MIARAPAHAPNDRHDHVSDHRSHRAALVHGRALARTRGTTGHVIRAPSARTGILPSETEKTNSGNPFFDMSSDFSWIRTIAAGASTYHGYKRNESIPWAIAWFFLGGLFPVPTVAVALAQGFGKKASK